MANVPDSSMHTWVNGEEITYDKLEQNRKALQTGINDNQTQLSNTYTKSQVDSKITNMATTNIIASGISFPSGSFTTGQLFYRSDLKTMYVYDSASSLWNLTPKAGTNVTVGSDGTISVSTATLSTLGVVKPGTGLSVDGSGSLAPILPILNSALFRKLASSGLDGAVTISANTTASRAIMFYTDLTVNTGTMLTVGSNVGIICVSGTLTLNGTIQATTPNAGGTSAGGSGVGGSGAGVVLVIANQISLGTGAAGSIVAIGVNGFNGAAGTSQVGGNSGTAGTLLGVQPGTGAGGAVGSSSSGTGGSVSSTLRSLIDKYILGLATPATSDTGAGGAGSGSATLSSAYTVTGGGGGAGLIGAGGQGNTSTSSVTNSSAGGGGGGGGLVAVISPNAIPAITISAAGGNGGTATLSGGTGGVGGGGGGGYALAVAPSSTATITAAGGTGGNNGGAGFSQFIAL